jgi:hypothetical protein
MPLEAATYISGLNSSNPVGVSDPKSQGDDHLRLIKATLLNTFPNITGAVNATQAELNRLVGVTGVTGTGKIVLDTAPVIAAPTLSGTVSGTPVISGAWTFATGQKIGDGSGAAVLITNSSASGVHSGMTMQRAGAPKWSYGTGISGSSEAFELFSHTFGFVLSISQTTGVANFPAGLTLGGNGVLTTATGAQLSGAAFTGDISITNTAPNILLIESDAPADETRWRFLASGGDLLIGGTNDAVSVGFSAIQIQRTGTTVDAINLFGTLVSVGGGFQARVATSSETSGALTSASANKQVHCSGNITLPSSGMTDGDIILIDPRGTARTVSRPGGHTMYIFDTDSATGTTAAHNLVTAKYHGSSKWSLQGNVV